jgi:hypothetical protein
MRASVVTLLLALLVAGCSFATADREARSDHSGSASPGSNEAVAAGVRSGPVGDESAVSCVEKYTAEAVVGRGFALAGTVESIGPGTTNRPDNGRMSLSAVTFDVQEWFKGGSGDTVTIDMSPPSRGLRISEAPSSYEEGTRLLVSGESRWGEGIFEDGLAWGCGFTRYYEAETASAWRAATA